MKSIGSFLSFINFIAVFVFLLSVTPSGAQIVRHVSTGGSDSGNCTANPCATLTYAIFQAAPGNVIQIAAGTYYESIIILNKSVIFRGAGSLETAIHGDPSVGGGGIFRINPGMNVKFTDVSIMKGVANEGSGITMGGEIYNAGEFFL